MQENRYEEKLFVSEWLANGQNATQAYLSVKPDVSYNSARTLGSRMLAKVDISLLLAKYDLGIETFMNQLDEGLKATLPGSSHPDFKTRRKYHKVLGQLLGLEK